MPASPRREPRASGCCSARPWLTPRARGPSLSLHIQERIARQQHLTEIGPDLLRRVLVLLVHGFRGPRKPPRRGQLILARRSAVRQPKRPRQPLVRVRLLLLQPPGERLRPQPREAGVQQR